MTTRQKIFITVAAVVLVNFFLLILFGEKGFTDLLSLRAQKQQVLDQNEALVQKNISLYHRIERLNYDPRFAEQVVRKDLGVVGKNEIIFKKKPRPEAEKQVE